MKLFFYLFMLTATGLSFAADTVTVEGHRYPVTLDAQGATWDLSGTEHFRYKVLFSVFTAGLYTQRDGQGERLTFTNTRKLKADDLREQAMKTLKANNAPATLEKYAVLTEQIQKAYVDVKAGDSYAITVIPESGNWLHLNGNELFFTENAEFGNWYLDIWLGTPPISVSLKEALTKGQTP
jgi:hypothetical protein